MALRGSLFFTLILLAEGPPAQSGDTTEHVAACPGTLPLCSTKAPRNGRPEHATAWAKGPGSPRATKQDLRISKLEASHSFFYETFFIKDQDKYFFGEFLKVRFIVQFTCTKSHPFECIVLCVSTTAYGCITTTNRDLKHF